ncbi:MAG TPA: hypothetical protein VGG31_08330 [Candidatus Dormibacteraeota bacterium]
MSRASRVTAPRLTSTRIAADSAAALARTPAITASARRLGFPRAASGPASATTSDADRAISSGISIVLSRAGPASPPDLTVATKSRYANASCSMSSSARSRRASAAALAAAAPSHVLTERSATFWSKAAEAATTAAAADPLAGAGAPDAISSSR